MDRVEVRLAVVEALLRSGAHPADVPSLAAEIVDSIHLPIAPDRSEALGVSVE